ncbi:MAG TPA: hypothetical protein VFV93_11945 [Thermomicrobiales bacterium]|nr:hypothetical protein [Thermomicrobiales bacterium]
MTDRLTIRPAWSILRVAVIGVLMLSLVAACGSGDDDDDDSGSAPTATTAASSNSDETPTESGMSMGSVTTDDMAEAMAVSSCLEDGTTGDIVTDLRDGDTGSAEDLYRGCLSDALPAAMVSQLDPIIEKAGDCGSEAAADLSDDDVAAIEDGDDAKIQQLTNDTLECLSADLGIDLQ